MTFSRGALRPLLHRAAAVLAAAAVVTAVSAAAASAAEMKPILTGQSTVVDIAFDLAGNMYLSDSTGQVQVLPRRSGTLFGQPVTAGTVTTLATLENVPGVAFHSGDLFMDDQTAGTISVLAPRAGKVFGTTVAADTVTTIASGLSSPIGIAFDAGGNLYVATAGGVSVLPARTGSVFGQAVTADTLTQLSATTGLPAGTPGPAFIAFDRAGDLFVSDLAAGAVYVLPAASGTLFGQAVTADTLSSVATGLFEPTGIALDRSGNLFISTPGYVDVLPEATGTLYGNAVTADTLSTLAVAVNGLGLTYYLGHPYLADQLLSSVDEMENPTAHILRVVFTGSSADPTITIHGYGFTAPSSSTPAGCSATGLDYNYGDLYLYDSSTLVQMGVPGDCVGLVVSSFSSTEIVLSFGSYYGSVSTPPIGQGDPVTVTVNGRSFNATANFPPGA